MTKKKVKINRAPVLTLWAVIVAEHMGYDPETALTLGKAVAGLNAQSKGRRLGIYEEHETTKEEEQADARHANKVDQITILSRPVPVLHTDHGLRAVSKGQPISPASVQRYLTQKFGEHLADVQAAMKALAQAYKPEQLATKAYPLYEKFRPEIPEGQKGWGAAGELDLDAIHALAEPRSQHKDG
ncbi:hypothetical protein BH10CHL1_BH10CHL1_08960 [soil metagenome]